MPNHCFNSLLELVADRSSIAEDGDDLSFITVRVKDSKGIISPEAANTIRFTISGPGEIVATDNGDPADLVAFPSLARKAYSGLALVMVRSRKNSPGKITVTADADGLAGASVQVLTK